MKTVTENKNGAGAGGAPESTAAKNGEKITLSAAGMTSLLKSEFAGAAESTEAKAGSDEAHNEIPAKKEKEDAEGDENHEAGAAGHEAGASGEAAGETKTGEEAETKTGEEAGEEAGAEGGEKTGEEAGELPEALRTELDAWEEKGGPLPGGLQALVDKRIGKLTGEARQEKERADRAEVELNATKAERDALRNDPNRPAHLTPAPVMGEPELNKIATTAKTVIEEAEAYLDDSATEEERGRIERFMASERLDAKGLKRRVREMQNWLVTGLPEARTAAVKFRETEKATDPVVAAQMPWLNDKASPEFARAQTVLALMPELQSRTPAHRVAVGTYVLGLKVLDHLAAAGVHTDSGAALEKALKAAFPVAAGAKAPAAKPKGAPPKTPAGRSAAGSAEGGAATRSRAAGEEQVRQQFNKAPTRQNATELARQALRAA